MRREHTISLVHQWVLLLCILALGGVQGFPELSNPFAAADPNAPKYIVTIRDKGSLDGGGGRSFRSVVMTDKQGKRFNCSLPQVEPDVLTGQQLALPEVNQQLEVEQAPTPLKTPFQLLEPLSGMCFYRQEGLWTYEVCHRKHARQFRQDPSGKQEEFSCGEYTGDEQQTEEVRHDVSASGLPTKFVSHIMRGGAQCTLTGQQRSADVRYSCQRDVRDNLITSVKEFPTCNYVITIASYVLCKHPEFAPPPVRVEAISCMPLEADAAGQLQQAPGAVELEAEASGRQQQQQQQQQQQHDVSE